MSSNVKTTATINFKKFGRVLDGKELLLSEQKAENAYIQQLSKQIEPLLQPEALSFALALGMNLDWIQRSIQEEINNIKEKYNAFSRNNEILNEIEILANGFGRPSLCGDLVDSVRIDCLNPFQWVLKITHETPPRTEGMDDRIYECALRDDKLFLNMRVIIYKSRTKIGEYVVHTQRISGGSYLYYHFNGNLSERLKKKEEFYKIYKQRVSLMLLSEGLGVGFAFGENGFCHIVKYLRNDLIVKEVCSFIGK